MPNPTQRMKSKRPSDQKLGPKFNYLWQPSYCRSYTRRLQMPSKQRGDEVCESEDIKRAGEDGAGYSVEAGCVPRYLWLVD